MMLVRLCKSVLKELYSTCLIAGKAYYNDKKHRPWYLSTNKMLDISIFDSFGD